eukprot:1142854-Pelagomonas_calceolata.AAC.5
MGSNKTVAFAQTKSVISVMFCMVTFKSYAKHFIAGRPQAPRRAWGVWVKDIKSSSASIYLTPMYMTAAVGDVKLYAILTATSPFGAPHFKLQQQHDNAEGRGCY